MIKYSGFLDFSNFENCWKNIKKSGKLLKIENKSSIIVDPIMIWFKYKNG